MPKAHVLQTRLQTRPRSLIHPGSALPVRIQHRMCSAATHLRLALQPGLTLYEALVQPLLKMGITSASTTILGGYFSHLEYCVAPPDVSKKAVINYTPPMSAGAAYMIFGNATLGKTENGNPLVHCHAALRSQSNQLKGGHIITERSVIGPQPLFALVTGFRGFELRVVFDSETNISLIQPLEEQLP